jgi:Rrf2 family protein
MITIPKSVDYSVVFISYLSKNKNKIISLKEVSKKLNLPYSYLSKLAPYLTSGNIIESQEGKSGGYKMKTGWGNKSFYDLLVALGENKAMVSCLGGKVCTHASGCSIRNIWQQIESNWQQELKKIKLNQI